MKKNTQKFVHYVMITFTYSVGVGTAAAIVYSFIVAFQNIQL